VSAAKTVLASFDTDVPRSSPRVCGADSIDDHVCGQSMIMCVVMTMEQIMARSMMLRRWTGPPGAKFRFRAFWPILSEAISSIASRWC